jgi:hypothetical protein
MAATVYAGKWWTRRVKLAQGEEIVRVSFASRFGFLGFLTMGLVTVTSTRLIWTPSPLFGVPLVPSYWKRWSVVRPMIRSVQAHRNSRWLDLVGRWAVRIETERGTFNFQPSEPFSPERMEGGRLHRLLNASRYLRTINTEWVEGIRQWANL